MYETLTALRHQYLCDQHLDKCVAQQFLRDAIVGMLVLLSWTFIKHNFVGNIHEPRNKIFKLHKMQF